MSISAKTEGEVLQTPEDAGESALALLVIVN